MESTWHIHLPLHDRVYRLTGRDAADLLQRISTNDLSSISAGRSATTILTNAKGRVVHVIGVHAAPDGSIWVAAVSDRDRSTAAWIERFIIMEDAAIQEVTNEFRVVVSFTWDGIRDRWNETSTSTRFPTIPAGSWANRWNWMIVPRTAGGQIPAELSDAGAQLIGDWDFHDMRVRAGVPWEDAELTDLRHPLEARLRSLISFSKGCYVGQEVVARLDSYRKVQQVLSRFSGTLPAGLPFPMMLTAGDGQEAGVITSVRSGGDGGARALGFVHVDRIATAAEFSTPQGGALRVLDDQINDGVYR